MYERVHDTFVMVVSWLVYFVGREASRYSMVLDVCGGNEQVLYVCMYVCSYVFICVCMYVFIYSSILFSSVGRSAQDCCISLLVHLGSKDVSTYVYMHA